MKTTQFLQLALTATLFIFLSVSTTQAQWLNDPSNGGVGNTDINTKMYRNGNVGIGAKNPQPTALKLYVNGRIGQRSTGTFGAFGSNDQWSSLGASFGPSNIASTYGLFRQWGGASFLSGVKDKTHGLVSWSGNGRLDFDYINNNNFASTKMSILSNGNVGIGTTAPGTRLQVNGSDNNGSIATLKITAGGQNMLLDGNEIDALNTPLYFNYNSFNNTIINGRGGNVGIGKTNPGFTLDVNGTTACTGGFWSSSDKRFKKDIQTVESALTKIKQLEGVSYKFKQQKFGEIDFEKSGDRVELGFIAQDLKKVFPELVRQSEDGYHTVRYEGLIPVLVEALKDQDTVVEDQKGEINTLKEEVDLLKSQLATVMQAVNALQNNTGETIDLGSTTTMDATPKASLSPNRPNPVNGRTTIDYSVDMDNAQLLVYDLTGKIIKTYELTAGQSSIEFDAAGLMNGTYVYAIVANGQTLAQQKMVIQK